jgi:phytoene synthase
MKDSDAPALEAARSLDRPRYLAALFAPADARSALFALAAFEAELSRVRDVVREPMLGEIRLQWWHDAVTPGAEAAASGHPVVDAVRAAADRWRLPVAALGRAIEAHRLDLYDDPFPTLAEVEGYAGETAGALTQLSAIVLAGGREAGSGTLAGHAGVAEALARMVGDVPHLAARGRCILPRDVLARHGADVADVFAGRATPAVRGVLGDLADAARDHLEAVRSGIGALSPAIWPAFLHLAPLRRRLDRLTRPGRDPFGAPQPSTPLADQWAIWRAARAPGRRL